MSAEGVSMSAEGVSISYACIEVTLMECTIRLPDVCETK